MVTLTHRRARKRRSPRSSPPAPPLLPDSWTNGVTDAPLLVCGEHAHYAVTRAAGALGLGLRSVRLVPSSAHRMDSRALLSILDAADRPVMAVVATAGSTATGSFDDLSAIGEICAARGIWLHIDGAHGAAALFSPQHRHRLRGIEHASSIALDPHKMMLLPLQAGTLLVRDARVLDSAFAQQAPYLFHGNDADTLPDLGVRSFLCSAPRGRSSNCGSPCSATACRKSRFGAHLRPPLRHRHGRCMMPCARTPPSRPCTSRNPTSRLLPPPRLGRDESPGPRVLQPLGRRLDNDDDARRPPGAARDDHESPDDRRRRPYDPRRPRLDHALTRTNRPAGSYIRAHQRQPHLTPER